MLGRIGVFGASQVGQVNFLPGKFVSFDFYWRGVVGVVQPSVPLGGNFGRLGAAIVSYESFADFISL